MKYLITIILLYSLTTHANPNFVIASSMHMDRQGRLIEPDKLFMQEAIRAYRKGYHKDAFMFFKKASALGNSLSQRYIGLMYVNALGVEKDLVKGYSWLKLASHDKSKKNRALEQQVFNLLSEEQKQQALIEYQLINDDYGVIAALTRRDKWVRKQKMKMTGSRTGSLVFAPLNFDTPQGNGFYNSIRDYVENYNFGYVSSGEIIPKDDEQKNNSEENKGDKK